MKQLGLAQSVVDTDLRIGFSLNDGPWKLRLGDKRPLLHKLSPFLGTDCPETILSAKFDAEGCVLNIYAANPETADGYFGTHIFIPGGVTLSGEELEDIIDALKVGDEEKIGRYFNKSYPDEGPSYRSRFSEVAAVRYYGEGGRTLRGILSSLYTVKSIDFNEIFFLDRQSPVKPDATIKDITGSEEDTRILTDLVPGKGSLIPDEMFVDGLLWEGTPIYTASTASIILKKKGYADVIIKDTPVDAKGYARFTPDWKLKIDFNTFRIASPDGENLDEYTITVNSEPVTPERSVSMPSEKAKKALVRVERPGFQVWEKEMDLTTAVRFTITLSKDVKTRQFFVKTLHDGKQAPFELILPDMLEESPLEGYRMKDSDGDRKATLVYDPFAFLHIRKWQLITGGIALGILLIGLLLGLLIGGGKGGEKKVRAPKEEKVATEQPAPAETKTAPAGLKAYLDTVKVLDRRTLDKYGQAALYDALNTYDGAKADSIAKSLEAKGLILELVDNMRYYTGLLQQSGKAKPSQWGEDQTINLERFNNSISNKISELSK